MATPEKTLTITFFVLGLVTQVIQVIFIRELAIVFRGTEMVLAISLFLWLLFVALGSFIGSVWKWHSYHWLALLPLVFMPFSLFSLRSGLFSSFFPGSVFPLSYMIVLATILFAPLCLFAGLFFATGCIITSRITRLYAMESAGFLTGGLLYHFMLNSMRSFPLIVMGGALLASSVFFCFVPENKWWPTIIIVMALWIAFGTNIDKNWRRKQWQKSAPGQKLLEEKFSQYHYLAMLELDGQKNLYIDGHHFVSLYAEDSHWMLQFPHVIMTQHKNPKNILLIGAGLSDFVCQVLKYPIEQFDYCHIDKETINMIQRYLPKADQKALKDSRLHIHNIDGRHFLNRTDTKYDIIIHLLPDPTTGPINRYYTLEFFRMVEKKLSNDGIFVLTLSNAPLPEGDLLKRNALIFKTLAAVFTQVKATPGSLSFLIAGKKKSSLNLNASHCEQNFLERKIKIDKQFRPELFHLLLESNAIKQLEKRLLIEAGFRTPAIAADELEIPAELLGEENSKVSRHFFDKPVQGHLNKDSQPRAILQSLNAMDSTHAIQYKVLLTSLEKHSPYLWPLLLPIFSIMTLAGYWRSSRKIAYQTTLWTAIAVAGFFGISTEIILMWNFLQLHGFLYSIIGIFTAVFMMGIITGTITEKPAKQKKLSLASVIAFMALYLFYLPSMLIKGEMAHLLILNFIAGWIVGFMFALAISLYRKIAPKSKGAVLYGADIIGAATGALVVGIFALPFWGVGDFSQGLAWIAVASLLAFSGNCFWQKKNTNCS